MSSNFTIKAMLTVLHVYIYIICCSHSSSRPVRVLLMKELKYQTHLTKPYTTSKPTTCYFPHIPTVYNNKMAAAHKKPVKERIYKQHQFRKSYV